MFKILSHDQKFLMHTNTQGEGSIGNELIQRFYLCFCNFNCTINNSTQKLLHKSKSLAPFGPFVVNYGRPELYKTIQNCDSKNSV
jgi:hypothetical protein